VDKDREVEDLTQLCFRWMLENTGQMLWDYRFHAVDKVVDPKSHARSVLDCIAILTGPEGRNAWARRNFGKIASLLTDIQTPGSKKRYIAMQMRIQEISGEIMKDALAKVDMDYLKSTDYEDLTVFQKLVHEYGRESEVLERLKYDGIGAGVETPGKAAMFFIYELARNPDKQEILYKEVLEVFGEDGKITEKGLNKMKYLRPCLHESQRIHPLVFGISRISQVPMVLEGYTVPTGTKINYCMQNATKNPEAFLEPYKFMPERWLRGHPLEHTGHPFATLHFSVGPRMCLGRRFVELEYYILAIKLLQRFRLEYHHEDVKLITEFVSRPDKKVKVRFIPRH